MYCRLTLPLLGLFLPLAACGGGDPVAPTVSRATAPARAVPRPPPRPDTVVIGLPVEPIPLEPVAPEPIPVEPVPLEPIPVDSIPPDFPLAWR